MRCTGLLITLVVITILAAPAAAAPKQDGTAVAIFAGGCFWCMEPPFDKLDGVISTTSGYTGGPEVNPSYEQVSSGSTQHREAVQIEYDPKRVSYEKLLEVFWRNIDPLDGRGQFCDKGRHYTSAIFALDDAQRAAAEQSKAAIEAEGRLDGKIRTDILAAGPFYAAEDYHQDYYMKNPVRYKYYRWGCGRDARLQKLWGDAAGH
ncbi:MAG TPA: peptide-methionine (S)-S-oxide reductase MsrA [Bryobacterales bacterium]|nr:peptide-methionine (S)-S-oxide reductase MsrA [Bryobacterales bacterium]